MKRKKSEIASAFPDPIKNHAVGVDELGREIWYMDLNTNRIAWRRFDKNGNVIYYKNNEGEEITRKFNGKNELIFSNDCGQILVDKRITRPIREKLEKLKHQYKYGDSLKTRIKFLIFKIRHRKAIKEALKKANEIGE